MKHAVLGHGPAFNPCPSDSCTEKVSKTHSTCHEMSSAAASTRKGRFHVSSDSSMRRLPSASVSSASTWGRICINVEVALCAGPFLHALAVCVAVGSRLSWPCGYLRRSKCLAVEVLPLPLAIQERVPIVASVRGWRCFLLLVRTQRPRLLAVAGHLRDQLHHRQRGVIWLRCRCACSWDQRSFLRVAIVICVDVVRWYGGVSQAHELRSSSARGFALRRFSQRRGCAEPFLPSSWIGGLMSKCHL